METNREKTSKENRKRHRLRLNKPLRVLVSSLGSDVQYDLVTHDLSLGGFFLDFESPMKFPFLSSSILEVCIVLDNHEDIYFLGKIARVVYANDTEANQRKGIAVSIILIENTFKDYLKKFIESYSEGNLIGSSNVKLSVTNNQNVA